jgi:hypothetical protein
MAAPAQVDFAQMKADIAALEAACRKTGAPVVFGHNDLLAGNILVLQVCVETSIPQCKTLGMG